MFTVIAQRNETRFNVAIGAIKDLIQLLMVLEESSSVKAYKVIDGDAGVLKDMSGYGIGHLEKMTQEFSWEELKRA